MSSPIMPLFQHLICPIYGKNLLLNQVMINIVSIKITTFLNSIHQTTPNYSTMEQERVDCMYKIAIK